jgi:hypothetical protein
VLVDLVEDSGHRDGRVGAGRGADDCLGLVLGREGGAGQSGPAVDQAVVVGEGVGILGSRPYGD